MPLFEDITSITPDVYSKIKYHTGNSSTNITGARVEQYEKLVQFSHKMNIFCRIIPFWCTKFRFQNEDRYESMIYIWVIDCLKLQNQNSMDERPCDWLIKVGDYFQPNYMNIWSNVTHQTYGLSWISSFYILHCASGHHVPTSKYIIILRHASV